MGSVPALGRRAAVFDWAYRVALNVALGERRQQREATTTGIDDALVQSLASNDAGPEHIVGLQELGRAVDREDMRNWTWNP